MIEVGVFEILLLMLVILTLLTMGATASFTSTWGREQSKRRNMLRSSRIGLDKTSFLYREGYTYEIYSLNKPRFALNKLWFYSWYITRNLKKVIEKYELNMDTSEFAGRLLTMNGDTYDAGGNGYIKPFRLNLEQVAELIKHGFNDSTVHEMRKKGMSFAEMMEFKGLPNDWVRRINA
jgi:hypothetical protein